MTEYADVSIEVVARLRAICLALPEAHQEQAWVGTRWRVRTRTFAHVLAVDSQRPPAYARAVAADGPVTVLTFRSSDDEIDALVTAGHPFFKPQWGPNVLGMVLEPPVDWGEVTELLTESYCMLAPRKLVRLVARPRPNREHDTEFWSGKYLLGFWRLMRVMAAQGATWLSVTTGGGDSIPCMILKTRLIGSPIASSK